MKMKFTLVLFAILITAFQLSAQCRLVRMASTDSTTFSEYFYDKHILKTNHFNNEKKPLYTLADSFFNHLTIL